MILLILGGSIFSIVLVSVITNINVLKNFDSYMRNEQMARINKIIELIEQSYELNNGWSHETIEKIDTSPLVGDFDVEIRDTNNNLITTCYMENSTVERNSNMMNRMGHGMMHGRDFNITNNISSKIEQNAEDENYNAEEYSLISNNKNIGTATIGYVGPFLISESEIEFTRGINMSILYSSIISVIIAILLGMYSSEIFSKPILQITNAANNIRKGNLDTKVELSNNIIELQELSESINHLSKSLSEQEVLRRRLTSDISHELRTPLTVLRTHIEAISDGVWAPTQDKLNICRGEVVRLIKLVEQLKNLTDIENHKLDLEITNYPISNDLEEIVKSFKYQFDEKGIRLNSNIQKNIKIEGDKDKIKQVFVNLLSNALKFTNSGGEVKVGLKENNYNIEINIEDTGIGMEEKDIPYVFERFYRSDISRNRKTGGSGIGLTITKSLIEAHKGKISVESKKDEGTKFKIMLPKQQKTF